MKPLNHTRSPSLSRLGRIPSSTEDYHEVPCRRRRRSKAVTCPDQEVTSKRHLSQSDTIPDQALSDSTSHIVRKSPTSPGDILLSPKLSSDITTGSRRIQPLDHLWSMNPSDTNSYRRYPDLFAAEIVVIGALDLPTLHLH